MAKPELEFFDTEILPWKPINGSPGKYEKILSKDPETGSFTRLILVQPDLDAYIRNISSPPGEPHCHEDMWEEVYIIRGTDIDMKNRKTYRSGYYACRPPGMKHGPMAYHPTGALIFEIRTRV
jgi:hypothetical protein